MSDHSNHPDIYEWSFLRDMIIFSSTPVPSEAAQIDIYSQLPDGSRVQIHTLQDDLNISSGWSYEDMCGDQMTDGMAEITQTLSLIGLVLISLHIQKHAWPYCFITALMIRP